ncbi:MAG: NIPSNAP family protein [Chloroflexi bacterium]|nr:NIPSNAP family protein [Chloroflexota bacterium]
MIYELRIYHATPGKLPALIKRFETTTLKFWEKHGIRQVGFWTSMISESNQDLYYMLEWTDLGERHKKWDAFMSDPDWNKAKAETIKDGELYTHISNVILAPTAFSKLK